MNMLKIVIPAVTQYDEINNEFIECKEQILQLEHSLVSLSKWESKWHKPFLTKEQKTREESLDYIKCMTITQNVSDNVYLNITPAMIEQVSKYIDAPMTATTFSKEEQRSAINREIITSEVIYYWMVSLTIPFECQKWHLNRLLTLINVCNLKNKPPKKMSRKDQFSSNRSLNAARRSRLHSRG